MTKKMTMKGLIISAVLIYGTQLTAQCGHDHDHSVHAGDEEKEKKVVEEKILTVGENAAVIKLSHNKSDGKVTLQILKDDKKTALVLEKEPRLNLIVDEKRKQLKTKAVGDDKSKYEVKDDSLKKDLNGKISIAIGDEKYQVPINPHAHGAGCNH